MHTGSDTQDRVRPDARQRRSGSAEPSPDELVSSLAICPPDDPSRPELRERTIRAWLPLAHHLARRYAGRGVPSDDLKQVAVVGLIESVDRFRAERGVEFASYAIPTMLGELKRHFRDHSWSLRVPRRQQELCLLIQQFQDRLTQELGRTPRAPDIADRLCLSEDEVEAGLQGARVYRAVSLSQPAYRWQEVELGDAIGGPDHGYERTEMRLALRVALTHLTDREVYALSLRFGEDLTQRQIGTRLGISQMHVSRVLTVALRRLRHLILEAD
jgi:RNA polymerase sigma-B factor